MSKKANDIVAQLTLKEKAYLTMGETFWHLVPVERLGLSRIMVADGPHGLRKEETIKTSSSINKSEESTCFPPACTAASSWDVDLVKEMGELIAKECKQEDVSVLLGPGANIKRSPLCGRNFEYYSEDPYLSGEMAAAFVQGAQSVGIGTSLKHYVMNNQERLRMTIDAVVDERAQREIYLTGFEKCVKQSQPWTIMCSYNKVDGEYLSENKRLLTDVLRDEWGFDGLVMTDWGAINRRDTGIKAGLDLEMPYGGDKSPKAIMNAVNDGSLKIQELDKCVQRVVELVLKSQQARDAEYKFDANEHHNAARKIAEQSVVLLKNEENILPLKKGNDICVIGQFAKTPRYQGAGSSLINPTKIDNACSIMKEKNYCFECAQGYSTKTDKLDSELIDEAVKIAENHEYAIIYAGLTDVYESESFDRATMDIPHNQIALIEAVSKVNKNIIVVLANGSPITMNWIDKTKAVVEGYLHGQAGAGAIVDILFGDICPSGKLAETFPNKLEDNPSYKHFPGYTRSVEYRESIYVGYRYYDTANKDVLFPFGHGLSYTRFEYSDLLIKKQGEFDYKVTFTVKNTGEYDGYEIAQLYIGSNDSPIFKAEKELKGFEKVFIKKGKSKVVSINLDKRSFAYYNVNINDWHVDRGTYGVLVGATSKDIRLTGSVDIAVEDGVEVPNYRETLASYYNLKDEVFDINESEFEKLLGRKLPLRERKKKDKYDLESTVTDLRDTFVGKILQKAIIKNLRGQVPKGEVPEENSTYVMNYNMSQEMPMKSLGLSGGQLPTYAADAIVALANKKLFKSIGYLLKK